MYIYVCVYYAMGLFYRLIYDYDALVSCEM